MKYSVLLMMMCLLPWSSWAADAKPVSPRIEQTIRTTMQAAFPEMRIKTVLSTPVVGIYELTVGSQIFYADKTGAHLMSGHLIDVRSKKNLTQARLSSLHKINWQDLPLKNAVQSGSKKGKKIAVFTDPDCPYCKRLEQDLSKVDGLRVYTFLFPLAMHPEAFAKSESIWCSKNRHQALVDVMVHGKTLPQAKCKTPVQSNIQLGEKLGVRGTPTIFVEDGRKFPGGSVQQLQAFIQEGS